MLPPFLVSPAAGVAADRNDRKLLLVASDLARMVVALGFLVVREPGQVWLLYALTAVQMGLSGVFFPARNALLPSLVSDRELGSANALGAVTWSVMLALGAAVGGLVAGRFGVYTAYAVDAATYLVSAALLLPIPSPGRTRRDGDRSVRSAVGEYLEGLRYLGRHRDLLFTSMHKALFGLAMGGAFQVVQVMIAQTVFVVGAGGSTGLGTMFAVAGLGTGVGPIVARWLTGDRPERLRSAIVVAYLLVALGIAVIAPLHSLAVVLVGVFLRGLGGGINWVFSTQLLMMGLPSEVRGRVFSTEFAAFTLGVALSTAVGGWALDHAGVGLQTVLVVLAVLPLVPGALWAWWLSRSGGRPERASGR
jgi:MFS family permease